MNMTKTMVRALLCAAVMCAAGLAMPLFAEELTKEEDFICEVLNDMSGIKITEIRAKDKSKVTKAVIPEAIDVVPVTAISGAFSGCEALVSVSIPNTVTKIGGFARCSSLEAIKLPASLTEIGGYAFYRTSLKSIKIPDSVTCIGANAFRECESLKSIVIPDTVTEIEDATFCDCTALESVTLPASLKTVGYVAFTGCLSLKEVIVPDGLTKVAFDSSAFSGCSSVSVKSQMALRKLGYKGGF